MPEKRRPAALSDAELEQFWDQGYVRLGPVVPRAEIETLCERIDNIMLGRIRYENMMMQLCPSAGLTAPRSQSPGEAPRSPIHA